MKRIFLCLFLILTGAIFLVSAQMPKMDFSRLPSASVEPFKIARGSSFSASIPRGRRNFASSANAEEIKRRVIAQDFGDALEIVRENYFGGDKINAEDLTKSAVTAMLRALDPHSNYYDAKKFQELLSEENSQYSGIGASIANYTRDGQTDTFITSTFQDSPAARAGLSYGDKIIAVAGESMRNKTSFYVREKIRGGKDTDARLTVERAISGKVETIVVRRSVVPQPSIPDAYILRPGVGYIDLSSGFNYTTIDEFNADLNELHKQGMTALILDLRDNPGGIVEQAVKVAEKFLPAGATVLTQRGRVEIDNRMWKSSNKNPETMPLVLLVNGGTASASEIVTGALQDYDRALVIGERTFGKGLVQSILDLPYGAGLTLTTAKYYTPSGRLIQRDYEHGNLYDYFQRRPSADFPAADKTPSKTVTGREVYGGDGIAPDETIKNPVLTPAQISLLDPIFFFTRELVGGRISPFENYKINRVAQQTVAHRIETGDFPAGAELVEAFKDYSLKTNAKIPAAQIEANRKFIITRLRYEMATAAYGNVAANQVLIESDAQAAKALDALPRAQNLALAARRSLQKR